MDYREPIARQFHSTLTMLQSAIRSCPEELWLESCGDSPNRYWHVAYHALFYTHFYLAPSETEFAAWALGRVGYQYLGEPPRQASARVALHQPYSVSELLEYATLCHGEVDRQMAVVDLEAASGFYWLPFSKLELQLYNLRHLAHHTGQMADRLRAHSGTGVDWVR